MTPRRPRRPALPLALLVAALALAASPAEARRLPYGCVMLETPLADWGRLVARVDPADLAPGEHRGAETWPHVTVLYGLHDDRTAEVLALLRGLRRPIRYRIVDLSRFRNRYAEVLKFGVASADLDALNRALRRLPHTAPHDGYRPHMTLAYVRPGLAVRHLRPVRPAADYRGVRLVYQTSAGEKYQVTLPGAADPARPAAGPELSRRLGPPAPRRGAAGGAKRQLDSGRRPR